MPQDFKRTIGALGALAICAWGAWGDWPTYRHDNGRSGITREALPHDLQKAWEHAPRYRPQPAWQGPARTDGWHKSAPLKPRMIFDWAFHVVADEKAVYFGSSSEDKVFALDAETGQILWTFYTEGPVRLAPTLQEDKIYFGADDGFAYCLDAATGSLVWKYQGNPDAYRLPGNQQVISLAPIRTGVLLDGDTAYFSSGLFSFEGSQLLAVNAADGALKWEKGTNQALQGYLLASQDRLYAPRGRQNPAVYDKADGNLLSLLEGSGGSFAVLVDDYLFFGPGKTGQIDAAKTDIGMNLVTFEGNTLVVDGGTAYMQGDLELSALDRARYLTLAEDRKKKQMQAKAAEKKIEEVEKLAKQQSDQQLDLSLDDLVKKLEAFRSEILDLENQMAGCLLYKKSSAFPYALIMAGDRLYAGGEDAVGAIDGKTGEVTWSAPVDGRALDLAVSNGRLLVSTDEGKIYCFEGK